MKKMFTLLAVLLLPLLAFAGQQENEVTAMAEELGLESTIKSSVQATYERVKNNKIQRVKDLIYKSQHEFADNVWSGGAGGTAGASGNVLNSTHKFYDTQELKQDLESENLLNFLARNPKALDEVADYTTEHFFLWTAHNDFETLLLLGVHPIEAALRTDTPYEIEMQNQTEVHYTIDYEHCYREGFIQNNETYFGNISTGGTRAISEKATKEGTTTFAEIYAIKAKLNK